MGGTGQLVGGLAVLAALILANGYFVAAEFAWVAASRPQLAEAARAGDRAAARALRVRSRLSLMLSGAQIGITLTSLLVGYLAEPTLGAALEPAAAAAGVPEGAVGPVAFGVAFAAATAAQMVVGELAPKNLAIARPEAVARALAAPTAALLRLAGPFVRAVDAMVDGLLRAVGVEPSQDLAAASRHDLDRLIAAAGEAGGLSAAQVALASGALRLDRLDAIDLMVPRTRVVTVDAGADCERLREVASESGRSRLPVVGDDGLDDVRGVAEVKRVLAIPPDQRRRTPVEAIARRALVVPETAPARDLLETLRGARQQLALVVDEHGGVSGLVTLEDLLEELAGEIRDEHDPADPGALRLGGDRWVVPGAWRPDEVARRTGHRVPEGVWETLGGLVTSALRRLPEPGDEVVLPHLRLRVLSMHRTAVGRVLLTPRTTPAPRSGGPAPPADRTRRERR